jgi:hypothetical protein
MVGITLEILERRLCELNGILSEVHGMKDYLLKMKRDEEKAEAAKKPVEEKFEPFVEKK